MTAYTKTRVFMVKRRRLKPLLGKKTLIRRCYIVNSRNLNRKSTTKRSFLIQLYENDYCIFDCRRNIKMFAFNPVLYKASDKSSTFGYHMCAKMFTTHRYFEEAQA